MLSHLDLLFQESPFSNYVSSLSPIRPVKTAIVVQDFPGIISPPHVFSSPRINPRIRSSFLERFVMLTVGFFLTKKGWSCTFRKVHLWSSWNQICTNCSHHCYMQNLVSLRLVSGSFVNSRDSNMNLSCMIKG